MTNESSSIWRCEQEKSTLGGARGAQFNFTKIKKTVSELTVPAEVQRDIALGGGDQERGFVPVHPLEDTDEG